MLCLGSRIRLTRREVERLHRITAIEPVDVRTRADLEAYVRRLASLAEFSAPESSISIW